MNGEAVDVSDELRHGRSFLTPKRAANVSRAAGRGKRRARGEAIERASGSR
jgi:phage gp29-like protein